MSKQLTSTGNTVREVLQKSPGIVVNKLDNSVTIYGNPVCAGDDPWESNARTYWMSCSRCWTE